MSTLQEELARLRTLQESYNELAARVYPTTETVTVNLYLPDGASVDWTKHAIAVYDSSDNKQYVHELDANGTCTFEIPSGHQYSIGFPQLATYARPQKQSFASTLYERHIVYEYSLETSSETVRLRVLNGLTQATMSILDGVSVSVVADTGESYVGTFVGASCDIVIPYGKTCTIEQPFVEGYRSESGVQTFTTGLSLRPLVLKYTEEMYGIFGVDEDGNMYSIEECEALEDKSKILYGFYNDATLAQSTRVDGGTGNGFYWMLGKEKIGSMQWAIQNVTFDIARLPFMENASGGSLAEWKYAGMYLSKTTQEIGLELFPDSANPTPAATACLNKSINVGGKEHKGFVPTFDQIYKIITFNRTLFQSLYTALGRTAPVLWNNNLGTICQATSAYLVVLKGGEFSTSHRKVSNIDFMCCFDI